MTTGKTVALTRWTFVGKVMSLLFNMLSRLGKVGLKLNIQKTKIMAPAPITSWEVDGETVADFNFLGSKITANGDRSHEIKRSFLLEKKAVKNLDSILEIRDITLLTNVYTIKLMVFPVVMYGYESWIIKMTEGQRIDAFGLWC